MDQKALPVPDDASEPNMIMGGEVQGQIDADFPKRMYTDHYRF